jgi:hypothetical protein
MRMFIIMLLTTKLQAREFVRLNSSCRVTTCATTFGHANHHGDLKNLSQIMATVEYLDANRVVLFPLIGSIGKAYIKLISKIPLYIFLAGLKLEGVRENESRSLSSVRFVDVKT